MDNPTSPIVRLLLAVALVVFVAGVALAIAQPGDLGDGDTTDGAAPAVTTSTTAVTPTTPTTAAATSDTVTPTVGAEGTQTTGGGATTTAGGGATTTTAASGLGVSGASRADDATAETGAEALVVPGLLLAGAALVMARSSRRSAA